MPTQPGSLKRLAVPVLVTAVVAGGGGWWLAQSSSGDDSGQILHVTGGNIGESPAVGDTAPTAAAVVGALTYERASNPSRTIVRDAAGAELAVLTDGARTVAITGPERTFSEPSATDAVVTTTTWVRLAPKPWKEGSETAAWFTTWFETARTDTSPDVFALAFQYVNGAPEVKDAKGLAIAGDASFGPFKANGSGRKEANDFYDYLGVDWSFPDRDAPESADAERYGSLDCSGFVRMVYGYRLGYPLRGSNEAGPGLPRRAFAIARHGAGVEVVPDKGRTVTDYNALQPGDLVFFEIEEEWPELDHMGIYMGVDDQGQHRFVSSRDRANGPTMGDIGGTSLLDDGGYYSTGWVAARRL